MRKLLSLLLVWVLIILLIPKVAQAQTTVFTPNCAGLNDTARFSALITAIGVNTATIKVPYKTTATRCAVNDLTIPANVTLDLTEGGIKVNSAQTLTIAGPLNAPPDKPVFFNALTSRGVPTPLTADVDVISGTTIANQGTVLFSGSGSPSIIQAKWWDLTGSADGAIGPQIRAAAVSLNGKAGEIHHAGGGYVGSATTPTTDFLPRSNINIVVVPEYATLVLSSGTYTGTVPAPWVQLSNTSSLVCRDNKTTILEEHTSPTNGSNGREWNIVANMYDRGSPADGLGNGSVGKNMKVLNCGFKGVRSSAVSFRTAISLGNCHNCDVLYNDLVDINSLALHIGAGSTSGADPLGLGLFANNFRVAFNKCTRCNSQNLSVVNAKNSSIDNNTIVDPGKAGGGGSTPIDVEPNTSTDSMYNIVIAHNTIDAKTPPDNVNNGIAVQNGAGIVDFGPVIVEDNTIIGGSLEEQSPIAGSEVGIGIFVNGEMARDVEIKNNYVRGAGQNCVRVEGPRVRIHGNTCVRVGSSSAPAILIDSTGTEAHIWSNSIMCHRTNGVWGGCDARIRSDADNTLIGPNIMVAGPQSVGVTLNGANSYEGISFSSNDDGTFLSTTSVLKYPSARYSSITPAQITSDQNNYNPGSNAKFIRLSTDASRTVTGLVMTPVQADGDERVITNTGSFPLVLAHQTTSSAANRFINDTGTNLTLTAGQAANCSYDGTSSRWRCRFLGLGTNLASIAFTGTNTFAGTTPISITNGSMNAGIAAPTVASEGIMRIGLNMPNLLGEADITKEGAYIGFDTRTAQPAFGVWVKRGGSSSETNVLSVTSAGRFGFSATSPTAYYHFAYPSGASGSSGVTAGLVRFATGTYTDSTTAGSGTATSWAHVTLGTPTLAAANASVTTTDAASLYVMAPPSAGTNMTITNPWSLWVDTGVTRLDGGIQVGTSAGATLVSQILSGSAAIDFGVIPANSCVDSGTTIPVTGALAGNPVFLGHSLSTTDVQYSARVSSGGTVTVRSCNYSTSPSADAASHTFSAVVFR